jgi:hypothetical protein
LLILIPGFRDFQSGKNCRHDDPDALICQMSSGARPARRDY